MSRAERLEELSNEEREEIKQKIMKMAARKAPFSTLDLIKKYMGRYHSDCWETVLLELIDSRVLQFILKDDIEICPHCGEVINEN